MPNPISLSELEAQFKKARVATQNSKGSTDTTKTKDHEPATVPLPDFYKSTANLETIRQDLRPGGYGRLHHHHACGLSFPGFGPSMPPKHGSKPIIERASSRLPGLGLHAATQDTLSVPPNFDPALRAQEYLNNRENIKSPVQGDHQGLIFRKSVMGSPLAFANENRPIDLPTYTQAYPFGNKSQPKPDDVPQFASLPTEAREQLFAGDADGVVREDYGELAQATGFTHVYNPPTVSAAYPQPGRHDHDRLYSFLERNIPPPTGPRVLPHQATTDQLITQLRNAFNSKLSSLEESLRRERESGMDAQTLSRLLDLEMRLKVSEAEKEKYKNKVEELEAKVEALEREKKERW